MKAIVITKHSSPDGMELQEVSKPIPKANEILIKVYSASVTSGDVMLRKLPAIVTIPLGLIFGFKRKRTPGHEFAGVVEAVGEQVTRFQVGDRVFGTTTGLSVGANAEYITVPETFKTGVITHLPDNISFEQGSATPIGGMTALQILERANIQQGQKVLIYGASGSVGSFAVQIAKSLGATVTGVCSTPNVEMVKSLGADHVIDYKKDDFTANGQQYDVVFDAVGKASNGKKALKPDGTYLSVKTTTSEKMEYLESLKTMLANGSLRAAIDRAYPLEQVSDAHRYVETGRKKGNIVITVAPN